MLFDGFTVCAQLLNFLLLAWLLKRFLYKPVLDAIDAREKLIASQLQDAEQQKSVARKERQEFQNKNEAFEMKRETLFGELHETVKRERLRKLDEVRTEAIALRAGFAEKISSERDAWQREIKQRTQREVFSIARQTLEDLAQASLEDQIADVLIRRLEDLDPGEKAKLVTFAKSATHPVLVHSAFELSPSQRNLIQSTLSETLGIPVVPQFEVVPAVVCGIEILLNGHKVAWSIADYLASVERSLNELLPEK